MDLADRIAEQDIELARLRKIVGARISEVLPLCGSPPWLCEKCLLQWKAWAALNDGSRT